ncbi:MAG: ECF-type riboflavin transporter substrate-binding protein [Turicibacter sp.]|nr:ECF-type riboflavin transporter substrate-binding protein [Turicibacter sp.]
MYPSQSIKKIVAIGIGAAIFVVLARFASLPTGVPNTSFETSYAILALIAILYGPLAGFATGLIGHFLKDVLIWGSPWFSWIIASAMIGLVMGGLSKSIKLEDGEFGKKEIIKFNVAQIIANIVGWFIVAPTLDVWIYAEPIDKVYLQGIVAGCINMITVGVLGTLLASSYAKTRMKTGSLKAEYE